MTSKEILKNKVSHLEQALLQTSFTMNKMEVHIDALQKQISDYKESGNTEDLIQNNDKIIDLIKGRLDVGRQTYHQNVPIMPRDDITRDNFYEAVEEALDLSVYLSAYMLRLMEERERQEIEPTTADEYNKDITMEDASNYGPPYSPAQWTVLDEQKSNEKDKENNNSTK
tara:strand:+ start:262 stop:771 length:510 start_codon:yes stop_codon:yes gene_type:complete